MSYRDYLYILAPMGETLPVRLNNPFKYQPSEIVWRAQREVLLRLDELSESDSEIRDELQRGKMMGVMVVRTPEGEVGYLAGFSGCMAGRLEVEGFVPPIFGRGELNERFERGDRELGGIAREIDLILQSSEYMDVMHSHTELAARIESERNELKRLYKESKAERDIARQSGTSTAEELQLASQRQKGEMGRREKSFKEELLRSQSLVDGWQSRVEELRDRRKELSYTLQCEMFDSYRVVNGRGETRSLYSIFEESHHRLPPSGAGECAAPKMLYYALTHNLTPISIGEFWVGESPRGEVRHHGYFYGACMSRCHPILTFMLEGVDVEPLETVSQRSLRDELRVIFEDQYIVLFDKPSGMLSVPGRSSAESVKSIVEELYPDATGALMVHRLDQDTSGLLLVAKSAEVHKSIQQQFSMRSLKKRYVAIVEGVIPNDTGEIALPLITNIEDRPRQMVDYKRGKSALTSYEVIERRGESTLLALYPHTGRTHQLRVHCAHQDGLNAPIRGDKLYAGGVTSAQRLMLHAEEITFNHPISGERLHFSSPHNFDKCENSIRH